jgi:hypothetical protein
LDGGTFGRSLALCRFIQADLFALLDNLVRAYFIEADQSRHAIIGAVKDQVVNF